MSLVQVFLDNGTTIIDKYNLSESFIAQTQRVTGAWFSYATEDALVDPARLRKLTRGKQEQYGTD